MNEYTKECLKTFLKKQGQLFDEPVAGTMEEAEDFLEDCMAVVVDSLSAVRDYLEESGMDVKWHERRGTRGDRGGLCPG